MPRYYKVMLSATALAMLIFEQINKKAREVKALYGSILMGKFCGCTGVDGR